MRIANLYDHIFDIDDIITAMCSPSVGKWVLNSRTGEIIEALPHTSLFSAQDGDDDNHLHIIPSAPSEWGVHTDAPLSAALYKHLKTEALRQLEQWDMIPPSMQRNNTCQNNPKKPTKLSIKIEEGN